MYLSTLDLRTGFFNWEKEDNDFAFSYDSVLKRHPSKFVGCCLANPAEDGTGIRQLEDLVLMVLKTDEEHNTFSSLLKLARFPQVVVFCYFCTNYMQVYVKFSALFRLSREQYPYEDARDLLSQVVSNYGANRVMWGRMEPYIGVLCYSDFPFVVKECGYKEAKEAVSLLANQIPLSSSDLGWIMGRTLGQLFQQPWQAL
ncbi:hypothetical protein B296_00049626 [Ensete ventricosum]|uniref:Uncharacterized protein n=1 Tax=Ensete ventricosum TaxID=4639 RepID=A0A426YPV8_ENSVE|nr:hypothetical protein B296_00049626 [Ensete ventricosum]